MSNAKRQTRRGATDFSWQLRVVGAKVIVCTASFIMLALHVRATMRFCMTLRRVPNLCPPTGLNDRFMWRKLFDHNPLFQVFCDKLASKDWVRERTPDLAVPETLWCGEAATDIPARYFQGHYMIKASNGSSYNIRTTGKPDEKVTVENRFASWLSHPYGQEKAEWGYKEAARKVFVEELITSPDSAAPVSVLVYCCAGNPVCAYCIIGWKGQRRQGGFFALDGSRMRLTDPGFDPLPVDWRVPEGFLSAIAFAGQLAVGIDQIRCDFLCVQDQVWFSEMTPYDASGLSCYSSQQAGEAIFRDWNLLDSWFLTNSHSGWKAVYANALKALLSKKG